MNKNYIMSFGSNLEYENFSRELLRDFQNIYPYFVPKLLTSNDLPLNILEFSRNNSLGFGYWLWKPYLIKTILSTLNVGENLLYVDGRSGLTINKYHFLIRKKISWLERYLNSDYDLAALQTNFIENRYTSADLFYELELDLDSEEALSGQYAATFFILKKNQKTEKMINRWSALCNNLDLLKGQNFNNLNSREFKEHRHDQSALSLLIKLNLDNLKIMNITDIEMKKVPNIIPHVKSHPINNE